MRQPEQYELDQAWEWIGEWYPEVELETDPVFQNCLNEIMAINDDALMAYEG